MRIEGERPYLSLGKFDPIELPDLTILIGVNGSGKRAGSGNLDIGRRWIFGLNAA